MMLEYCFLKNDYVQISYAPSLATLTTENNEINENKVEWNVGNTEYFLVSKEQLQELLISQSKKENEATTFQGATSAPARLPSPFIFRGG